MTTKTCDASSSLYRIKLLRDDNWLLWKHRVTGVLHDRRLLKYVDGTEQRPVPADPSKPTVDEKKALVKWDNEDVRAQTQIELTLSDPQMIHIVGAKTTAVMWRQLRTVKEARGQMGIISARRRLY